MRASLLPGRHRSSGPPSGRLVVLAGLLVATCGSPPADPLASVRDHLPDLAAGTGADDVALGVYRDGALVTSARFAGGVVADDHGARRFELGSLAKHITAVAVLRLRERGLLALDDPLGRHLRDVPEAWRAVTLEQLLTHTSGIPDYEAKATYDVYERPATPATILGIVADDPMDFPPGTDFAYSNTGYYLLSLVIESVSEVPFAEAMRREILRPAGMTESSFDAADTAARVPGFKTVDGVPAAVSPLASGTSLGAGALISTVEDWGRWQTALRDGTLLPATALDRCHEHAALTDGREVGYGLGLILDTYRGAERRMHTGTTAGFAVRFESYPESGWSFLVLSNRHDARLGELSRALALALVPGLDYRTLPVPPDPDPARTAMARAALEQAVLGDGDGSLLTESMRGFAQDDAYAPLRRTVEGPVRTMTAFQYLKTDVPGGPGPGRHVFRGTSPEGVLFWTITLRDSALAGLNWEDS